MLGDLSELGGPVAGSVDAELLDTVFRCLGAGVYATDHVAGLGGRVLAANPACAALLGYTVSELLGAPIHDLVHYRRPDGSPLAARDCALFAVADEAAALNGQDTFWRRDGTPLPVAWAGAPLLRDGVVVGTVVTFTDDTERRRTLRREHDTAVALQRALLTPPPAIPGLELAVRYQPSASGAEVGGDWYDAFVEAAGGTLLAVGDVVGHDTVAAAAMGQLRGLLRGIAYALPEPPSSTLARVEVAADGLGVSTLATVVLARLGVAAADGSRRLDWANAGHPPPLLLGAQGAVRWLDPAPDILLGVLPGVARHTHTATLESGDTVLLVTDGLIERRGSALSVGLDRLAAVAAELRALPLEHMLDELVARLTDGAGSTAADDIAVLAVRLL